MHKISFVKKLITCSIAGLVIGEAIFRQGVTYFRSWVTIQSLAILPPAGLLAGIIYALIWQARSTSKPATLAFWQGLIRYGVAFDLAEFGWAKIFHRQLVMPGSLLDLPYSSFSPSELFWTFFSHSYLFSCIIATLEIVGAMLLLFRRTRLAGVFVLLPVLGNILMMDIFYAVGAQVHAAIMMLGVLYFLFIDFDRLREFFFAAKDRLPAVNMPRLLKAVLRLSIIIVPILLIAMAGNPDKHPELTGKYAVTDLQIGRQVVQKNPCDSVLTLVYFDIKNRCVFEFNSPQRRWNGNYSIEKDSLKIDWRLPEKMPSFNGTVIPGGSGKLTIQGTIGRDTLRVSLQKTGTLVVGHHW